MLMTNYLITYWINTLETNLKKKCLVHIQILNLTSVPATFTISWFLQTLGITSYKYCIQPKALEEGMGCLSRLTGFFSCPMWNLPIPKHCSIIWATVIACLASISVAIISLPPLCYCD